MVVAWCLITLLAFLPATVRTWDVMVASEGHLQTLTLAGELNEVATPAPLGSSVSLAVSPGRDTVFLGDSSHPNASIFRLDLASGLVQPLVPKLSSGISGLALDPMNNILYWTTGYNGRSILKANVGGQLDYRKKEVKIVHKFGKEIPQGIAIDSCGRFLFWTNINPKDPSIERSNLDGSKRSIIVKKDLNSALGIAVDQAERKLYWSQELEGLYFSIERSDLDGSNREVMRAMHHQPYSLAIGTDYIYWADWTHKTIWRKDKSLLTQGSEPLKLNSSPLDSEPTGLVAFNDKEAKTDAECRKIISTYEDRKFEATTLVTTAATDDITVSDWNDGLVSDDFCLNSGAVLYTKDRGPVCRCLPGFTGVRCEIEICFNFCVHGTCSMDKRGAAACTCDLGYFGSRCEQDLCSGFCLNGGHCSIEDGKPSCDCHESFKGPRCEVASSTLSKLCQLYCDLALEPMQTVSDLQSLCVCPTSKKNEYLVDGINGTVSLFPDSHMFLKKDTSFINDTGSALLITLGCVSLLLLLAVVLLVFKVMKLRRRPRIKKRFIGSKPVTPTPLTNRPSPATDQCEINIENCCNMNICETPCFEPNLRTSRPGSKREEKKTLLDSMENSQGGSHDDLY